MLLIFVFSNTYHLIDFGLDSFVIISLELFSKSNPYRVPILTGVNAQLFILNIADDLFLLDSWLTGTGLGSGIHHFFLILQFHFGKVILDPVIMASLEQVSQRNELTARS